MQLPFLVLDLSLPGIPELEIADRFVPGKFFPGDVQAYHEGTVFGTCVYMRSGIAFIFNVTVEQYEKAVNQYWIQIEKDVNKARTTAVLSGMPIPSPKKGFRN